jgi:cathepsin L
MQGHDWIQGVNEFTDRTDDELKMLLGYRRSEERNNAVAEQASLLDEGAIVNTTTMARSKTKCAKSICVSGETCTAAGKCKKCDVGLAQTSKDAVDWSSKIKGMKGAIMDQGSCGSCWAIASAGAIEAQITQLDSSTVVRVSPEAIVQCSPNPRHCGGDGGCQGSTPELAFAWAEKHSISTLGSVPYTAKDLTTTKLSWCHKNAQGTSLAQDTSQEKRAADAYKISIGGYVQLPVNQEEPVVQALVCSGPVVVAGWASTWFSYSSGILKCPSTGSVTVDHAILMVGFGVTHDQKHYWRIKNSWGTSFGEGGFLRLARYPGKEKTRKDQDMQKGVGCKGDPKVGMVAGECGILSDSAYPVGAKATSAPVTY